MGNQKGTAIRNVLVPLDGTTTSESILPYLEALLKRENATVTVSTVALYDTIKARRLAQAYLDGVADRIKERGAFVDTAVLAGDPGAQIAAFVAERKFDLVALCSRAKTGVKRLVLGSVAEEVLRNSQAPTLIVHSTEAWAGPTSFRKILVPVDGSHRSLAILPVVEEVARAYGAHVTFLIVLPPGRADGLPPKVVSANLLQAQKTLHDHGLSVSIVVRAGRDAASEILALAEGEGYDLVAMSSHGRTGVQRLLMGSVAEAVLRRGRVPVLVRRAVAVMRPHHEGRGRAGARARRALNLISGTGGLVTGGYRGA